MASRRSRRKPTAFDRLVLFVLGAALVVVIVVSIAGSIASTLVSPSYPGLRSFVALLVLCSVGTAIFFVWRTWDARQRTRHRALIELLALTPAQFEEAIGDILRDSGFRHVRRVGAAGDLCADLIAVDPHGVEVVVQCKRLAPGSKVGSPDIQKFIGMATVHHRVSRGIFVTTSAFTGPAEELARAHSLDLWDGAHLAAMLVRIHAGQLGRANDNAAISS